MSVKDPKTNICAISGEVVETIQERAGGAYTTGKIKIKVWNLAYDKDAKKEIYKAGIMEVKAMGKSEGLSSGSPLAVMRSFKVGDIGVFVGKKRWDFWTYNDKECSKIYLDAREIGAVEPKEKPKPVEQTETEAGITEDDIPF